MDPQKLNQLDPKLKDAYMKVMGMPVPEPQDPSIQAQSPIPNPVPTPDPNPVPDPTPVPTPIPEPEPIPTPTPTINQPPQDVPPTPPVSEPEPTPQPTITPEPEPPTIPTPEPTIPQQPSMQATNFEQMNSEVAAAQASPNFTAPAPMPAQNMVIKKKSSSLPILIGVAMLIFIAVYTLFWTKIFNFTLPF